MSDRPSPNVDQRNVEPPAAASPFLTAAFSLGMLDENATQVLAREAAARQESPAAAALRTGALAPADVDIADCLSRPREIAQGYEILGLLGRGGMGVVFRARQLALDREVALKTILASQVAEPTALARFEKEARVVGRLIHPHIVTAYDFGRDAGRLWLAMELLSGEDAFTRVRREGRLAERLALGIIRQAASGLAYASSQGVVHRDVKPANLMLTTPPPGFPIPPGEPLVKVADFGLAILPSAGSGRLTATINMVGSPHYMAPEQFDRADADERADIYALGITAYELLAGKNPFAGLSLAAVVGKKLSGQFPTLDSVRAGLSTRTLELIWRMTEVDPSARFPNYGDLLEALDRASEDAALNAQNLAATREFVHQATPRTNPRPTPAAARSKTSALAYVVPFLLTALVLGNIAAVWWWFQDRAPQMIAGEGTGERKALPKSPSERDPSSATAQPEPKQPPEPTPPPGPQRDLQPGDPYFALFDGRSLRGWQIIVGTWSAEQGEDGAVLQGKDGIAQRRLSVSGSPTDETLKRFALSLVVDVRQCERAEIHVDLPANDQPDKRIVLTLEQGQASLGHKADEDAPFFAERDSVALTERVAAHSVTIERHSSAWFFKVDDQEVGVMTPLRPQTAGRMAIVVENGVANFSDLAVQSLE